MNNLKRISLEKSDVVDYCKNYTLYLSELMENIDYKEIEKIIDIFLEARDEGKKIFFIGNGGSAATSTHFTEDLCYGAYSKDHLPFRAMSLVENVAYITALGNDEGYENSFVGQLRTLLDPGDIVVGISASGNSPNVTKALEYANVNNGITIGLVGFNGGKMKNICDYCVHIETMKGEYGPVEDIHLIISHLICTYLKNNLKNLE